MNQPGKRAYSSQLRTEQARRTRAQIVQAAGALFAELGFAGTTIDAIATAAGVSRKTVFTAVPGGKVELLKVAYDYALAGDDEPIPMIERPAIQRLRNEPDPYRRMSAYAEHVAAIGPRVAPLYLALRGAAEVDPEARRLFTTWEEERRVNMLRGPVAQLVAEGALQPGITAAEAADVLWLLTDPSLYHRLVGPCGWSQERFRDWVAQTISDQLFTPTATAAAEPAAPSR